MEPLQEIWKQNLRPHAVVGYGVKIFLPSPPNYVTRSPGDEKTCQMSPPLTHCPLGVKFDGFYSNARRFYSSTGGTLKDDSSNYSIITA